MTTPYQAREFEGPQASAETAPYWEAAQEGRLLVKRCEDCQALHHFPRSICPHCGSERTQWIDTSGRGVVYAVSVTRRGTPVPYAMAYVTLDEGVTLMTNIVDCDLDTVKVGQKVKVAFKTTEGGVSMPVFAPA